ncbi:MAG: hypothetical protein GF408_07440, partial [Candidatus Omnitrophica bacterium]|nr:hypothetical protein [Candidatus Omnitrophota bacterium]
MSDNLKRTVYLPNMGFRHPVKLTQGLIVQWIGSMGLGWALFLRDIKAEYRQSVMGISWVIFPPILTACLWIYLNKQRIINIDPTGVPYPVFVLTSMLFWSSFAQSVVAPFTAMRAGISVIIKLNFPKEALLISGILKVLFDLTIRSILVVIILFLFNVKLTLTALLAPVALIMLVLLGFTIGFLLLPIGMLFTDISRFLHSFLPVWMLLSPVIYPVPKGRIGNLINSINPVSPLIVTARNWLFGESVAVFNNFMLVSGLTVIAFF